MHGICSSDNISLGKCESKDNLQSSYKQTTRGHTMGSQEQTLTQ